MEGGGGATADPPPAPVQPGPAVLPIKPVERPARPIGTGGHPRAGARCPACGAAPLTEEEIQIVRKPGRRSTRDAADPRNRAENLVTKEFLVNHIVRAQMSLRDIGSFHGYTISTLSRRAKQEDVPVGVRARAAAENGLADGGAEAASPIKPAAQQAAAAAQRPAQRRKPATAGGGSKSKAARSQAQEEDDDEEESDAEQHWRPVKRSRRELKVAAAPAVQPLPALPLAEVGLPQLLPGAQLQELDLWQAQAHATAQQVAQQEADAIWAHVAGQTVQVAVEAPPAASALRQQHHDEEMHEADSDEDEVAELLGMLRHRSPARAPMGERTAPAAAAAGSVGDSATQREPVPAPPVTEQQQQQQHDDAVKEEQLPVLSEQQPQVAAAGEAAGQPPAAAPGGEEQQPAPEQQPCLKSTGAEGQAAEQQQQQQQLAEPAPSSQALAAVGQGSLGADQATAAASKHELGQQERDQRLFYYDAAAENVEKEVAALEAEVEVAADAHLAPFTAPLGEELALALEATPPGSPRHTAAVPTVGSPTEQQGGAAGQAPGDASACASAANGDAGSLSPQMAAVKASATQHMLQRAVESFQCADIASSESMLLPLRRLQCVGKGGAPLQEVVERWHTFPLSKQQDLFSAAVLHATEGRWEQLQEGLRLELGA